MRVLDFNALSTYKQIKIITLLFAFPKLGKNAALVVPYQKAMM